ncbi:hypothetical protein LZ30DRAFT_603410 [Colletotrichum cereale]|nr:hypothetical protein LZ30DRAFT_603410 [Colletotrichum cereale]
MFHFSSILGPKWPIVLLTLEENWVMPSSPAFRRLAEMNQIQIMYLPANTSITGHHSVSVFLTEPWFWEQFFTANRILVFQAVSVLCANAPVEIEDFLEWDLVGAPISPTYGEGYNGGLSLRNPKLMLEIVRDPVNILGPNYFEDQWFFQRAKERGAHLPEPEEAMRFAVETISYDKPLGYHQPGRWQQDHWKEINEWCPEVGLLCGIVSIKRIIV